MIREMMSFLVAAVAIEIVEEAVEVVEGFIFQYEIKCVYVVCVVPKSKFCHTTDLTYDLAIYKPSTNAQRPAQYMSHTQ